MHNRHPQDLQKACIAFIASLRQPAAHHAVYGQTLVDRDTGSVSECIVIHCHPNAPEEFRNRQLPNVFKGYPVVRLVWPTQDL